METRKPSTLLGISDGKIGRSSKKGELPHYFVPENNLLTFKGPKALMRNANIINGMKNNPFEFALIFLLPRITNTGLSSLFPPNIIQS